MSGGEEEEGTAAIMMTMISAGAAAPRPDSLRAGQQDEAAR